MKIVYSNSSQKKLSFKYQFVFLHCLTSHATTDLGSCSMTYNAMEKPLIKALIGAFSMEQVNSIIAIKYMHIYNFDSCSMVFYHPYWSFKFIFRNFRSMNIVCNDDQTNFFWTTMERFEFYHYF